MSLRWIVSGWMLVFVMLAGCQGQSTEVKRAAPTERRQIGAEPTAKPPEGPYWPRFHGPNGDNLSTETGLLNSWPEDGPPKLWTAEGIGSGYAGVTIADGLIYTSGNLDGKTAVTALDFDGNIQWQTANGDAWEKDFPGTRGTPTIDGDRVYHLSPVGRVACYEADTGKEIWNVDVLKEFGADNIRWALAESLSVDGDHVICCPGGPQTAVVALDKVTGKMVWASPSASGDPAGYCSPTLAVYEGIPMILVMTAEALIGVDADHGDLLFRHPHPTKYKVNVLKPIFHEGRVFVSSGYGSGSEMLKLTVDGRKVAAERVWENKDLDNHHGGVLLLDGYLYGSSSGGRWMCLDWETGEAEYSERGVGKGSLTYADGMLYTLSENHTMGLAPATPEGLELTGEFKLPASGEGKSWAHPVVCGGRLYIRHGAVLHAYDVKQP